MLHLGLAFFLKYDSWRFGLFGFVDLSILCLAEKKPSVFLKVHCKTFPPGMS